MVLLNYKLLSSYIEGVIEIDLNILISTIMTSTAALVAIIGGFLVSRIITLSGEKNSLEKRIREVNEELDIKDTLLRTVKQVVEEEDIDDFVRYYAEDILINKKTIEDILEEDEDINLEKDVLELTIVKIAEISKFILTKSMEIGDNYELPVKFNDFIRNNCIKIENDRSWNELIYDLIYKHTRKQSSNNWGVDILNSAYSLQNIKPIIQSQEYRSKVNKINNLEDDIKVLSALRKVEEDMLKGYGEVSGLWSGLLVLIYACIVGIIAPSFLLPYPMGYYDDVATKNLLLSLFISELLVLFMYLGFSMYRLTRYNKDIE